MNRVPSLERKTPQLRGGLRESVKFRRWTESGGKRIIRKIPLKVNLTGRVSVGFQRQRYSARRYCGTSKAQTPRVKQVFGWEAASKAGSMTCTPVAILRFRKGKTSQPRLSLGWGVTP